MATSAPARTPWHLWAVGIISLIWNAFGGYDYTMSQLRDPGYLQSTMGPMGITPEQASAYLDGFPVWATALWAVGVWGSILGSILLLIRSRYASWAFAASFVGAAINFAYEMTSEQIPQLASQPTAKIMPFVILAAIALQWFYSQRQTAAGVLH